MENNNSFSKLDSIGGEFMSKTQGVQRLREIVRVFTYYGFDFLVSSKLPNSKKGEPRPQAFREALEELGATFVKIGQILSTRPDLLPKAYIKELEKLQDENEITSFDKVKEIFQESFGTSIDTYFTYFSERPLASASIAQVHRATLLDGREVVVKVQHYEIAEKMKLDLSILRRLSRFTTAHMSNIPVNPFEAFKEIEDATLKELDFIKEAKNTVKFKVLNKNVACVSAPTIIDRLTYKKVLTMEYIEGYKITDDKILEREGYDRKDIANKLANSFFKQVFEDGFFHGDPHPGNLFIKDGKIYFIDFGLVGELDANLKKWLTKAMIAMALDDIDTLVDFVNAIAIRKGPVKTSILYDDLNNIVLRYINASLKSIKISDLFKEIFDIAERNNLQMPKELVTLVRSIVILEGVVAKIDPDLEIMEYIFPYIKERNKEAMLESLDKDKLIIGAYKFAEKSLEIPTKFSELVDSLSNGRTKMQIEVNGLDKPLTDLNRMVNRISFALIVGCMIIGSSLIVDARIGPTFEGVPLLGVIGFVVSGVFGFWLLISIIKSGFF